MTWLFPAKHYTASKGDTDRAFQDIYRDLDARLQEFESGGKVLEYERLKRRTRYDLEMIKNTGFCSGIENYSRYFDDRKVGDAPYTLLDYFGHAGEALDGSGNFSETPRKFLTIVDESHVTLPQIRGMSAGDRARKDVLIEHGFRLPSARDNRPLNFGEFDARVAQCVFTSATPDEFELRESAQIVEQIVRPTGLIDPEIVIRPIVGKINGALSQVEDLLVRIDERIKQNERVLVTTLTKKMAEDLSDYLREKKIKVKYLHSDVDTLDRIAVITALRRGEIDVIVGVNLLREGLDMPEVSLVAILDADKEGFLRNTTSLIQTIGRAARNVNGRVVMYADHITGSIQRAIDETARRRTIQLAYNKKHGITPKTIEKAIKNILAEFGITGTGASRADKKKKAGRARAILDLELKGDDRPVGEIVKEKEKQMRAAAKDLQFELAAILRDEIAELKRQK